MNIKLKLRLGVGLLFLLIVILAVLGMVNIVKLNRDTQNILVANYNTLDYSREMIMALDQNIESTESRRRFEENLSKQQHNITEVGERELTDDLAVNYQRLLSSFDSTNQAKAYACNAIRKDLTDIMLLNMQAIQRKSDIAKKTASEAIVWISVVGLLCFCIAFALLVNLPSNIANPIHQLTESIKQISERNYSERIHFDDHHEFGRVAKAFNSMAMKLEEYKSSTLASLMVEKMRFETLIGNMHDPLIGLDESNHILFVNAAAIKLLNLNDVELKGMRSQDVALKNDLMRTLIQDMVFPNGKRGPSPPLKIFADGKESYFEKEIISIEIKPTGESHSQLIGHFIILRNVTTFKELDFAKTNFIATISHELKTPISTIKASVHLLESEATGALNEEQKQLVASIKDDSTRLLKITSELLHLSQAESGNMQLTVAPCDPFAIINIAVDAVKFAADQKQVRIAIEPTSTLKWVLADAEKTTWVLINLLTNAIRYSPVGQAVRIHVANIEQGYLSWFVHDDGPGIDKQYIERLFSRYYQVPGSSKSGTGLGLAISKEIIEAQGGSIGVDAQIGKGSTFYFKLPIG